MINPTWGSLFAASHIEQLDFYKSNHRALKLSIHPQTSAPPLPTKFHSRFCFEATWLDEPTSYDIINCHWTIGTITNPLDQVNHNILQCSKMLSMWHREYFGGFQRRIKAAQSRVSTLANSPCFSAQHLQNLHSSEKILDDLLAKEETYWHQRSRTSWLKASD